MSTKNGPFNYSNAPKEIKDFINGIVEIILKSLGEDNLKGVYLHGSLCMDCFYIPKSDIDILAVSNRPLDKEGKSILAKALLLHSQNRPTVGDIEFSLLLAQNTLNFTHPTPYELHCGDNLWDSIESGSFDYEKKRYDPDLAAHCMVILKRGIVLYGEKIEKVFGDVPWSDYLTSVLDDFEWIIENENILESPFYCVLNGCRVIHMLTSEKREVLSKEEGAVWALQNLPKQQHEVIELALKAYRSGDAVSEDLRRTNGQGWPREDLLSFRNYLRESLELYKNKCHTS